MKHILIVDDNKMNLLVAKKAISDIYEVSTVMSGKEALAFLESSRPDLILLDIKMPQMDGFEVMAHLQADEKLRDIPIIFLTADNDAQMETKCLECGALDYIVKPFVASVMRSRIARVLELERLRLNLLERLNEKIEEVSVIKNRSQQDPLTGLWNRVYLERMVKMCLESRKRGSLFMLDLDNFKLINDTYGHQEGDCVLKTFAEAIQKYAKQEDIVCRIGGDEFMIYTMEDSRVFLENKAEKIIAHMSRFFEEKKYETNSSVSIGIAKYPEDGEDFQALYNAADKALYYVKQNGKDSYHFYSDQYAEEKERSSNKVDLKYLRDVMYRMDLDNGAYILEYDSFHYVYNFLRRIVERSGKEVQTILFTLKGSDEAIEKSQDVEMVIELLERAVVTSVRRVDVATRYSSRQFIVVLMDANEENGKFVAERILTNLSKMYRGELYFEYDIVKMDGKKIINVND